jgi:hypothetical protein
MVQKLEKPLWIGMVRHAYNTALGRQRQEDPEFEVILGYIASSRSALATSEDYFKGRKERKNGKEGERKTGREDEL